MRRTSEGFVVFQDYQRSPRSPRSNVVPSTSAARQGKTSYPQNGLWMVTTPFDGISPVTSLSVGVSSLVATSGSTTPTTTNFEPVLDVPALATFSFILVIFVALLFRTNQVENAVQERNYWLEQVRDLKSKELAGGGEGATSGTVAEDQTTLQQALQKYEEAVLEEEQLRNILPGVVRIVPPSAASEADEKAAAMAKQFLGKDYDIGSQREKLPEGKPNQLPTFALAAFALVFLGQLSLFVFMNGLSNDPMSNGSMM